ncbi:DUF4167 domain-containing protein [Bosea vaviloviae]|uniref:DUF4167 domain-containing protein n=1 Tax=Bosea vaviloviae TaxID=1526658 RepID=A0A1D7U079_9HYPH|nr:DUF4167 domain-containing protein [Bosea vaviloviae]AOO80782.1 hypothetical protein BHK69_10180 [Bosea vaviloviae]
MRGRNNNNNNSNNNGNRKTPNPLQRGYESNGPDVKVRGTAQHVAEKYLQLARDAQSSGDPVAAENYFQHAEHYYRILLAAQEQMSQQFGHSFPPNRGFVDDSEEGEEEGDDDGQSFQPGGQQPDFRNGGMNGNGNGYSTNGAPRQDGDSGDGQQNNGQRFDRQPRNQQDRPNQDRPNNDRPNQDRPNQDRQNNDRNGNRRFDRNDRNDRGERRFDRPEGGQNNQGGYAPRPDAPRSDIPVVSSEQPEVIAAPVQSERRFERADRPERTDRPERAPRPERRPRREVEAEPADDVSGALPSFLTTPVRVPVAVVEEPVTVAPAPADTEEAPAVEAAAKRPRGRRRSPREVMDALGSDADNITE